MIKTRLQILEKMHDETLETVLYSEAEVDLIQGRVLMLSGITKEDEQRRIAYTEALNNAKKQMKGHETMLAKITQLLESEKKKEAKKGAENDLPTDGTDSVVRPK